VFIRYNPTDQPGEKLIQLHEPASTYQYRSNKKIPIDIRRRRLYQAIELFSTYVALWGSESWALKEESRGRSWKRFTTVVSAGCASGRCGIIQIPKTTMLKRTTAGHHYSPTIESIIEVRRLRSWLSKLSAMRGWTSQDPQGRRMLGA
jgi:hypothetical protein